ncbi:MAG: NAD(P)-dependent oxidoreductase [Gemmatimonadota bacterium]
MPYPLSHYGQSKLFAEAVLRAYGDVVPHTILRFPPVYGPRDRAVLILFQLVRRGFALTVGGWDREISLIYVKDAVRALLAAGDQPAAGATYTAAHPQTVTWRQFAGEVGRALRRTPRLLNVPRRVAVMVAVGAEAAAVAAGRAAILNRQKIREMTQRRWVCDGVAAARQLGYRPAFPIERGVPATARWYEEASWL